MKKKLFSILICIFSILIITGCKNDKKTEVDLQINTNENINVEENLQKENTFDIEQYPNIKQISNEFIEMLENNTVNYTQVLYKVGKYTNGEYKEVVINLNENEEITMKFSDDGLLLVLYLFGGLSETPSKDYENSKLSMLQFKYYNFTKEEILSVLSSTLKVEDYRISNYEITSSQHPSFNMFIISDVINN